MYGEKNSEEMLLFVWKEVYGEEKKNQCICLQTQTNTSRDGH